LWQKKPILLKVLKRSALADDKDTKALLSKMQDDILTLRHHNTDLEDRLAETQDQLRRAKLMSSITASFSKNATDDHHSHRVENGPTSKLSRKESELEPSDEGAIQTSKLTRVKTLALSGIHKDRAADRLDTGSSESPPITPTRTLSARGLGSPSVKPDAFRVEHLKVELETARKDLSKLHDANHDLVKKLRDAERELSSAKTANRSLEANESAAASVAKNATKRAEDAEQRRKELLVENAALQEAETKMRQQIDQAQRDIARAKEESSNIRAQLEKAETAAKKESDAKRKAMDELATLQKQLQGKEAERTQLTRSVSKSIGDLQGSRDEMAQLEIKQAKLEREVQLLTTQITQLTSLAHERQVALDVAHNDARANIDKIRELSASLNASEEAQKKSGAARKRAEEHATELEQQLLVKEQAREAAASELEHRKKDLALQESEIQRLKSTIEFMEKSVEVAKQSEQSAQREVIDAKHKLDHANAELQVTALTIDQLQRDAASQQAKAIAAATSGSGGVQQIDAELQLRLLAEQLTTAQKEKIDAETKYHAAEKERAKCWTDVKDLQTKLNRANADLQMGGRIVQDFQAKLKEVEAKYAKAEEDSKRLHEKQEKVMDALRGDLGNAKREIKIKDGLLATSQASIAELNAKLKAANEAHTNGSVSASGEVEELKSELDALRKSLDDTQQQLSTTKHGAATMAMKVQAQQSTIESQQAQIKVLSSTPPTVSVTPPPPSESAFPSSSSSKEELDKLKRELELSAQVAETSKTRLQKLQSELDKSKADAAKQEKSDSELRKTLSRQCEHWQHQSGAYHTQLDKIKKEMAKNQQLRATLEPLIGTLSSSPSPSPTNTPVDERTKSIITVQAFCRGALSRLRNKHWRYRYLKMKEIVDTEESYLKALDLGYNYFLNPLHILSKVGDPIITQEEIDLIFSTLDEIRKNNKEVLAMLRARLNTWHVDQMIGDVFNEILNKGLLQSHVTFAQAYSKSSEGRVRIAKENVNFSRLLSLIRMLPPMEGRSLEDILISPIQRIPRYILLLNDMVKHTSPNHVDSANLIAATQAFQQFATFINENNRRAETMTDINARLVGYESLPENPVRKLIHEGRLNSISKSEKIGRYVFLFNDYIVFGKEAKNKRKSASVKGSTDNLKVATKFIAMIKISSQLTVVEIGTRDSQPFLLSIMVGESPNLLQAHSESDMKLWLNKLRETIEEFHSSSVAKSPVVEHRHPSPSPNGDGVAKEKSSRRLSVGSAGAASSSTGSISPTGPRAVSPARTSSLSSIPVPSLKEIPEESPIVLQSSSSSELGSGTSTPTLQQSSSSGSLEVGSSRKARTLAKRHKDRKSGPGE
jgi:DNA repair exonuclease SbcCD ATPase subunit